MASITGSGRAWPLTGGLWRRAAQDGRLPIYGTGPQSLTVTLLVGAEQHNAD